MQPALLNLPFTPGPDDLWFLPLGGCGEIGMNLNLFGHDGAWLMVDCGVTFEETAKGQQVQMADPAFIADRAEQLAGFIVTHAHQDHFGAVPWLWPMLEAPVTTTAFTANVLIGKLRRERVDAPVMTVREGSTHQFGPFTVTWLPITHSTPETNALLIETPVGRVLHTADWKIDENPVVGDGFDARQWQQLGDIDAVICDSTNALSPGRSVSEAALVADLTEEIAGAPGRVVVGCFASNIARLQTLGHVAEQTGRYIALFGRSLQQMAQAARGAGYLAESFNAIAPRDIGYLPRNEVLAIATGSQGEVGAALRRLAEDSHPDLNLDPGDRVLFSSRAIPGNEQRIERLNAQFMERGIDVVHADASNRLLHASGHPCAEELEDLYRWVAPRIAVPVHGEPEHMVANADIARRAGAAVALTGRNGDLFRLGQTPSVLREAVPAGRMAVDDRGRIVPALPAIDPERLRVDPDLPVP
ncbi:MAG: MBL fold metallo-hydrolase [Gammaproteobacteria bacterium]|nr:MBL fold metallo-hydrolase [Gammaproteobacteria bacterium]